MFNYKMTITYDGTQYSGWQIQLNSKSIQGTIQEALRLIFRHEVSLFGSGRTDAGVHALGQIAHFHSPLKMDLYRLLGSLNGLLPHDIRILDIAFAPLSFHSRQSATSKVYQYYVCLENVQQPFRKLYSCHFRERIRKPLLHEAAKLFVGTHDFTSFANDSFEGAAAKNAVRTILRLDLTDTEDGIRFEIEANGFLYKMVRNIVGTILDVAKGKRSLDEIPEIFAAKDRKKAGQAVPSHGLFLYQVNFPSTLIAT